MPISRRLFLERFGQHWAATRLPSWALGLSAASAGAAHQYTDYKALVCVFLQGGNDAFNTILRTDALSWSRYRTARMASPSLLLPNAGDAGGVLSLGTSGIALHPQLPHLQGLFDKGQLAIVPNVGPLIEPVNKKSIQDKTAKLPSKLYSHNDQQSTWQSLAPEGASVGWGGKMLDRLQTINDKPLFSAISTAGNAVWLNGQQVKSYHLTPSGVIKLGATSDRMGVDRVFNVPEVASALKDIVASDRYAHVMERDLAAVARRSMDAEQTLSSALPTASWPNVPGSNLLTKQLDVVARAIAGQSRLGMRRQIFLVNQWGYDTHDGQATRHARLLNELDRALAHFHKALAFLGKTHEVTTFTASDFGRTMTANGDGTDHGWGGHHFVMGGAVNGGRTWGEMPVYGQRISGTNQFQDSEDQIQNGVLIPSIAIEELGAELAAWMGIQNSERNEIFPLLARFDVSTARGQLFRT